ncbi:MAG: hypothetical protein PF693_14060 [Spirochaetia bacterium]|nr:hypothetical protein [Spirochaetia bacterium]
MKKQMLIIIILILAVLIPVFSLDGRDLYNAGHENYKQKQNEVALEQFIEFRNLNLDSIKADDALWYIGRLYERLDRIEDAENTFREVLIIENSNRLAEAAYDLSQILYSQKSFAEIIALLAGLQDLEQPDSYEIRSMSILGDTFYRLGRGARSDYNDSEAADYFIKAADIYESLLEFQEDEADRADTFYNLGKSYRRLATLELNKTYYAEYFLKGVEAFQESGTPRALALLADLENSRKTDLQLTAGTQAGFDSITQNLGLDIAADVNLTFPLGFNKELLAGLTYAHDDFSFKTFNFDPLKTGDTRLIQSSDKISADIAVKTGSSRNFLNTLRLDGDLKLAEDTGDNYYFLKLSEDGLFRINNEWKTGWNSEFSWKVFPDYLVGGHQIDSVQGDLKPFVQWYFADRSDVTLTYGLNLKQYLEAKYDTAVMGVDSTKDRQYITNSMELDFNSKIGSIIDTSLSYELLYLESNNYDVWITDSSATDLYIKDYNDYLQHTIKGSADFQWTDKLRTDFDGSVEIRSYTNYIAQDASGVFLSGDERRNDITFTTRAELGFILWENLAGASAELIGQFWWDNSTSNMKDEGSFDTNSEFFGGLLGARIRLP